MQEPKPDKPAPAKLPNGDNEISEADEMKARNSMQSFFMNEIVFHLYITFIPSFLPILNTHTHTREMSAQELCPSKVDGTTGDMGKESVFRVFLFWFFKFVFQNSGRQDWKPKLPL
jgi:hypothetical protein